MKLIVNVIVAMLMWAPLSASAPMVMELLSSLMTGQHMSGNSGRAFEQAGD